MGQFRDLELVARSERDGSKGTIARCNPDAMNTPAVRKLPKFDGIYRIKSLTTAP